MGFIEGDYKRNYNRWFDPQIIVLKATSAVVEIANLCLEADIKNVVINAKDVVVKAIEAITLLGKANHQMTFEKKEGLKNVLSEDNKTISEQDILIPNNCERTIRLIVLKKQWVHIL